MKFGSSGSKPFIVEAGELISSGSKSFIVEAGEFIRYNFQSALWNFWVEAMIAMWSLKNAILPEYVSV